MCYHVLNTIKILKSNQNTKEEKKSKNFTHRPLCDNKVSVIMKPMYTKFGSNLIEFVPIKSIYKYSLLVTFLNLNNCILYYTGWSLHLTDKLAGFLISYTVGLPFKYTYVPTIFATSRKFFLDQNGPYLSTNQTKYEMSVCR